jgi:hypothetical protein
MKVNFTVNVKAVNGQDLVLQVGEDAYTKLSLKDVVVNALTDKEIKGEGEKKYTNWKLAQRIELSKTDKVEVSIEELGVIKDAVALQYKGKVSGWVWDYLENGGNEDDSA